MTRSPPSTCRGAAPDALCCLWCALHRWQVVLAARDAAAVREVRRQRRHGAVAVAVDDRAVDRAVSLAVQQLLATDTLDPHTHHCDEPWPEVPDRDTALFRPLAKGGWPLDRAISDRQIARIIAARGRAAGYSGLRGHTLRAGAATEASDRDVRLEVLMALGGWTNPATALSYDLTGPRSRVHRLCEL
ncbi:hypothetical protein [Nocardia sp. NPDC058497]|uniref:hypothetical protein n=1 Tax=Nocardia sp. NPDC058497 TaxID=3346529 RepID=UPI00364B07FF